MYNWTYVPCSLNVGPLNKIVVFKVQPESAEFSSQVEELMSAQARSSWRDRLISEINAVRHSNLSNRYGLRIPLRTTWNIPLLDSLLVNYPDKQVVEWLQYGWPIGFHPHCDPPDWAQDNHRSAVDFAEDVDRYILKEITHFSLLGPFEASPFAELISCCALSTRSKRESSDRRILMDYSWPIGRSINCHISKDSYLGEKVDLVYPRIDDLCERVAALGPRCLLFKKDIKRAFKTIGIDLRDVPLQGFRWRNMWWFDLTNVMGSRLGPYIMQRVSSAIVFIHNSLGYFLLCYADDFSGAELPERAWQSYNTLGQLFRDLGVPEALEKSVSPASEIVFLGTGLNAERQVIFVIPERMCELMAELDFWRWSDTCTRKQLESLIGKLQFCANCVRPGRLFISRMLSSLKQMTSGKKYDVSDGIKMDVKWWADFLPHFRSEYLLWPKQVFVPDELVACDASLRSAGAVCGREYFHADFPQYLLRTSLHIADFELLAVVLAFKVWTATLCNKKVVINCDNEAVVRAINSGRAKDPFLQAGLRELVFLCCCNGIEVKASHIKSVENRLPDYLSRWNLGIRHRRAFYRETKGRGYRRVLVSPEIFKFACKW